MSKRCSYVHPNGKSCRRWPQEAGKYCYHHTARLEAIEPNRGEDLHPLLRLTTPGDVFDVIRETLNAARLGRIRPSQVYAVGYATQRWCRMYNMKMIDTRVAGLHRQMNPDLVDEEEISEEACAPVAELAVLPNLPAKPEVTAKLSAKKSA